MSLLFFHHNGLAVASPEPAFTFLKLQGYVAGRALFDPAQGVNLAMWHHDSEPDFEVIWPGDIPSPIDAIVKRYGPLVYHCCYETTSRDAAISAMEEAGLCVIDVVEGRPAPLFGGREVSFHIIDGVGLIELLMPAA